MSDEAWILVIDDSELLLERIKQRLERERYRVMTTTQTVGAARLLLGTQLVIIDWHMPGISGGEVLTSFRQAVASSAQKPLFYLYTSDQSIAGVAKGLGFDGLFVNKGNEDSLVRQIKAAFMLTKVRARG